MKKKVLIITSNGFPEGGALANRIFTIAKGLGLHDINSVILINRNTEDKRNIQNPTFSEFEHFNSLYAFRNHTRKNGLLKTMYIKLMFKINTIAYLINNRKVFSTYIVFTNSFIDELLYLLIAKLLKVRIVKDETEIPEVYFWEKGYLTSIRKRIYIRHIYRLYDYITVITDHLADYFVSVNKISLNKVLLIPMMVDLARFETESSAPHNRKYLCYAGSINFRKDGIDKLIEAFSLLKHRIGDIDLVLLGNLVDGFEPGITNESVSLLLKKLRIEDRVILTGNVSKTEVVRYLKSAEILIMPRPQSIQSEHGFPTKLGEYLAAGRPVISTIFGEIEKVLQHGENAYLIPENSSKLLAEAIENILNDKDLQHRLSMNAYMTAERKLNSYENVVNLYNVLKK